MTERASEKGRWLFKEEPTHYSFDRLQEDGGTRWNGVENNAALKHLRRVKRNDEVLFYHTGSEKQIVGVMKATSDSYPDPYAPKGSKLVVVDVKPVKRLKRAVTLVEMKTSPDFAGFELLRLPRLSVMPVPDRYWSRIMKASET